MSALRQPGAEPVPGYKLLEPLGAGGFGEVWKCTAPGGLLKAIKFVHGARDQVTEDRALEQELRALGHVRAVRHPFLLALDRVEVVGGGLVLVTELAERSLHDLLGECRAAGLPGVPRDALLAGFREAAEALDVLALSHGLQHLDVKPQNLLLLGGHVKVADFGLVSRLDEAGRVPLGPTSAAYAAPEMSRGTFAPTSDQYGLAVAWVELLTGELPFRGANPRQLALLHSRAEPDLARLPGGDRPAVARALAKDPASRWPSCTAFVAALAGDARPAASRVAAPAVPEPACPESLADYAFEECLARGDSGETWAARTESGPCTVEFVYGMAALGDAASRDALARLDALGRPPLVPATVVRRDADRLVVAYRRLGPTLRERLRECRAGGLPGVPRGQLLRHLRAVAAAVDAVARDHGLPHLALTPEAVQLSGGGARVTGAGLAALLRLPAGHSPGRVNPLYGPPPPAAGGPDRSADAYAMAVIYQEMLTGRHPFRAAAGASAEPDLAPLPPEDRPVLARALDPAPGHRFATCAALVDALEAAGDDAPADATPRPCAIRPDPEAVRILEEVIAGASGGWQLRGHGPFRYLLQPGACLRHQFVAGRQPDPAELDAALARLGAAPVERLEDRLAYQILMPGEGWGRLVGRPCGLDVRLHRYPRPGSDLTDVDVEARPFGCRPDRAARLLEEVAVAVVADLRTVLGAHPDRRTHDRVDYSAAVEVRAAGDESPVRGRAVNLSRGGIGLHLPARPGSDDIRVYLAPGPGCAPVPVPAKVVRARPAPGGYDVGVLFLADAAGT